MVRVLHAVLVYATAAASSVADAVSTAAAAATASAATTTSATASSSSTASASAIMRVPGVVWVLWWGGCRCWGWSGSGRPGRSVVRISPATAVSTFHEQGLVCKQVDLQLLEVREEDWLEGVADDGVQPYHQVPVDSADELRREAGVDGARAVVEPFPLFRRAHPLYEEEERTQDWVVLPCDREEERQNNGSGSTTARAPSTPASRRNSSAESTGT